MANQEQLEILTTSTEGWNRWRDANPTVIPDLQGSDLRGAPLAESNLRAANLFAADLREAELQGAELVSANLVHADLRNAELRGANLRGADLSVARMARANAAGADLRFARLAGADLKGANLGCVDLGETVLTDVNLAGARGLDSCRHWAPIALDHRTLIKSGKLPAVFLRRCGLPEDLIEQSPTLFRDPLRFYSCFVTYSIEDQAFAERLYPDLQAKGLRCWFRPGELAHFDHFAGSRRQQDRLSVMVLSPHSMHTEWAEREIQTALQNEERRQTTLLFPIALDGVNTRTAPEWLAPVCRTERLADFSRWREPDVYQGVFAKWLGGLMLNVRLEDARLRGVASTTPNDLGLLHQKLKLCP